MATLKVSPEKDDSVPLPASDPSETNKDTDTHTQANTRDSAFQANTQGTEYTPVLDKNGDNTPSANQIPPVTQQHTADKVENGSDQQPITPAQQIDATANVGASPSAQASTIVPGLSDVSADELLTALGSGIAPAISVGTLMVDLSVSTSLSRLGLAVKPASISQTGSVTTQGPVSETGTEQQALTEVDPYGTTNQGNGNLQEATRDGNSAPEGYEHAAGGHHSYHQIGSKRELK